MKKLIKNYWWLIAIAVAVFVACRRRKKNTEANKVTAQKASAATPVAERDEEKGWTDRKGRFHQGGHVEGEVVGKCTGRMSDGKNTVALNDTPVSLFDPPETQPCTGTVRYVKKLSNAYPPLDPHYYLKAECDNPKHYYNPLFCLV